jgi:thiol:disulfide interchange protein
MKKVLASFFTMILVVALMLGAIFLMVRATLWVTAIASPLERGGAIVAEIFLGVVLLLGTVWLATHLAVRIFSATRERAPSRSSEHNSSTV